MSKPLFSPVSNRRSKAEEGVVCSTFTYTHIIHFSYTIDTHSSDEEKIKDTIEELKRHYLKWLVDRFLSCERRSLLGTAFVNNRFPRTEGEMKPTVPLIYDRRERLLRSENNQQLGIVGFKSWPHDVVSNISSCFPMYSENDTCSVVFGTVTTYLSLLNPTDTEVTENQKDQVEEHVRYQMMTLMKSGILEDEMTSLKHARYLSPIVVINDKLNEIDTLSNTDYWPSSDSVSVTIPQSILIISACFAVIGALVLLLTVVMLYRNDEEPLAQPKADKRIDNIISISSSTINYQTENEQLFVINQQTESGYADATHLKFQTTDVHNGSHDLNAIPTLNQSRKSTRGNDWGTMANMSTTMRRAIVINKVSNVKGRGVHLNLGSVTEEDEDMLSPRKQDQLT